MSKKEENERETKKIDTLNKFAARLEAIKEKRNELGLLSKEDEVNYGQLQTKFDVVKENIQSKKRCELAYRKKIKETTFNDIKRIIDKLDGPLDLDGYYPTVEELEMHRIADNVPKYISFILYYASDPLSKFDDPAKDSDEYKEMVDYCNRLIKEIEF